MQDSHLRGNVAPDLQSGPVGYCGNPPVVYAPKVKVCYNLTQ